MFYYKWNIWEFAALISMTDVNKKLSLVILLWNTYSLWNKRSWKDKTVEAWRVRDWKEGEFKKKTNKIFNITHYKFIENSYLMASLKMTVLKKWNENDLVYNWQACRKKWNISREETSMYVSEGSKLYLVGTSWKQ